MNHFCVVMLSALLLTACSSNRQAGWNDIDYSRVHATGRENDSAYTQPSVLNCVDDDLYNCNR